VVTARCNPHFAKAPYSTWGCSLGWCVLNAEGINCLTFTDKPGAVFTDKASAEAIAEAWNKGEA
jgi:hypothetical protein